jgi:hypothetical protein
MGRMFSRSYGIAKAITVMRIAIVTNRWLWSQIALQALSIIVLWER